MARPERDRYFPRSNNRGVRIRARGSRLVAEGFLLCSRELQVQMGREARWQRPRKLGIAGIEKERKRF